MVAATEMTSGTLIAASKVIGAAVYNIAGERLGSIEDIMIEKDTGRTIYVVMSFGGFLGMEEKHHPLPWATLRYDLLRGGYLVNLDKQTLTDAPNFDRRAPFDWTPEFGRKVDDYYASEIHYRTC
jgi:hypothetical protein